MHPAAFLALLTIAMLMFAALRLELNFRRTLKTADGPEPQGDRHEPRPAPELRIGPAGGYCQKPLSGLGKAGQARRAGFAL